MYGRITTSGRMGVMMVVGSVRYITMNIIGGGEGGWNGDGGGGKEGGGGVRCHKIWANEKYRFI